MKRLTLASLAVLATLAAPAAAQANVLFTGSFTAGQPISKAEYPHQSYIPGHVTAVTDPTMGAVAQFAIANNDFPYSENYAARADMSTPNLYTQGSTLYTSIPIKISAGLPAFHGGRTSFYQFAEAKDTAASFPSWGLGITAGSDGLNHWSFGTTSNVGFPWLGPVVDGGWHTFVLGAYYTTGPNGWLELWMDGKPITMNQGTFSGQTRVTGIHTITDSVSAWPLDIDSYRSVNMITGTMTTYHGAPVIGTTLADVTGGGVTGGGGSSGLTAAFTAPTASTRGTQVSFNGSSSTGSPVSYRWTDGTATLGTGTTPSYTFHYAGVKHVTLTVTNASGATASVEHNLTVS